MTLGCKSPASAIAMALMAVVAALLHPAAAATELNIEQALTTGLILGEESLVSIYCALLMLKLQTRTFSHANLLV